MAGRKTVDRIAEARRRIEHAGLRSASRLDLTGLGLTELPESIWTAPQAQRAVSLWPSALDGAGLDPAAHRVAVGGPRETTRSRRCRSRLATHQLRGLHVSSNRLDVARVDRPAHADRGAEPQRNQISHLPESIGQLRRWAEIVPPPQPGLLITAGVDRHCPPRRTRPFAQPAHVVATSDERSITTEKALPSRHSQSGNPRQDPRPASGGGAGAATPADPLRILRYYFRYGAGKRARYEGKLSPFGGVSGTRRVGGGVADGRSAYPAGQAVLLCEDLPTPPECPTAGLLPLLTSPLIVSRGDS